MRSRYEYDYGMRSFFILLMLTSLTWLWSVEVRVAKGEFQAKSSIQNVWNLSQKSDIDVFSMDIPHYGITEKLYLFANIDIYSSKQIEALSHYADSIMNSSIPLMPTITPNSVMENFFPLPSSYEVEGLDMNIGIAKELIGKPKYSLGAGVLTGVSTPFIKMQNYLNALNYYGELLEFTQSKMKSYKAGVMVEGSFHPNESINLYAKAIYAYQKATISNSLLNASMKSDGNYRSLDIGLRYLPSSLPNFYIGIGHSYKDWRVDTMEGQFSTLPSIDMLTPIDVEFSNSSNYFSIGYKF